MFKAVFLDMDETLCDTTGANNKALKVMAEKAQKLMPNIDSRQLAQLYLSGIYRQLDARYTELLTPINDEATFRIDLINLIIEDIDRNGEYAQASSDIAPLLQKTFDESRTHYFDFFPNIKQLLIDLRKQFCLVVITNGPEFSQVLKVQTVELEKYVDHIIIGGQEKEQKPALSIFQKALALANCEAHQAIHIGDSLSADIAGANNAGIRSVWISHGQTLDTNLDIKPNDTLDSPLDLDDFFKKTLKL